MPDPMTMFVIGIGVVLLALAATAGATWAVCSLYQNERVERRDEIIKTLKIALEQEHEEAKVAAISRRDMKEADRARAEALAAGSSPERLKRVLALFPSTKPKPAPTAFPRAADAGKSPADDRAGANA